MTATGRDEPTLRAGPGRPRRRRRSSASCSRAGATRGCSSRRMRRARRRRAVRVLRGPADGERPAGHPSRVRAHGEGPLLPPSRDEGLPRRPRKAGWDTHGLPVEIEVEKRLGIRGKQDIEKIGVAEFNRLCRESVFTYREDWEKLSERMAYWLDYEHPYVTYTQRRTWRACGGRSTTLYDEGAALSRPQDPAVLPALRHGAVEPRGRAGLRGRRGSERVHRARSRDAWAARWWTTRRHAGRTARRILVWTTTPWTLVSNAALAVHPELDVRGAAEDGQRRHAHDHPGRSRARAPCSATTTTTRWDAGARR